jgi:hypothetical protein
MRAIPCLLLVLVAAGAAFGWTAPWLYNVCNSAPQPNGTIIVNADAPDVLNPADVVTVTLFYSLDNQSSWNSVPMSLVGEPGLDSTFAASFAAPGAGTIWYYVRAGNGTNYGTQGPKNSGNAWPVGDNWLAELCLEPTGDTENNPDGPFLDLTSCAMGYSDTYFYGRLTNNDNEWPTDGGWLGPWYLYTVGFRNADAYAGDTFAYAMTYADAPLGYGSGLYEINVYTEDFAQIGDIDVSTNGNRLVVRCLVSDVTSRHGFQPWPNSGGFLCAAKGDTRSANIVLQSWRHDSTNSARFFVNRTPACVVGTNRAPVLTVPRVFPRFGEDTTTFRFTVGYADADTNLPVLRAVVVGTETLRLAPNHRRYYDVVSYAGARSGFAPGTHWFHFVFDDGMGVVETAADSFVVSGGTDVAEQAPGDGRSTLGASPNPFRSRVRFALAAEDRLVEVFDRGGRLVARLRAAGRRLLDWDGRDEAGAEVPDGVYFWRTDAGPLRRLLVRLGR